MGIREFQVSERRIHFLLLFDWNKAEKRLQQIKSSEDKLLKVNCTCVGTAKAAWSWHAAKSARNCCRNKNEKMCPNSARHIGNHKWQLQNGQRAFQVLNSSSLTILHKLPQVQWRIGYHLSFQIGPTASNESPKFSVHYWNSKKHHLKQTLIMIK